jgi:DNA helicase-2/ATP-dependent DNA helicase PcrA
VQVTFSESADLIEVLNLTEAGANAREAIDNSLLDDTRQRLQDAGVAIRDGQLPRLSSWCGTCGTCDVAALCRRKGQP